MYSGKWIASTFLNFVFIAIFYSSFAQELVSFPDSMYQNHRWQTFVKLEKLTDTIDYRNVDYPLLNAAVFFLTNREREKHGQIPFVFSPALRDMADFHSQEMAKHEFVDHTNLRNFKYSTVGKRSKQFNANALAENVASAFLYHYESGSQFYRSWNGSDFDFFTQENELIRKHTYLSFAESLVQNWMDSKPHRASILHPGLRKMGCAVRVGENDMKKGYIPMGYGTQNFSDF